MKIGLLTLPFNNNYGGLLQCYALQTFLKKQGHEVYIIKHNFSNRRNFKRNIKHLLKEILGKNLKYKRQVAPMKQFEDNYLQKTSLINSKQVFRISKQPKITRNIQA